jgi:hypothetical protein
MSSSFGPVIIADKLAKFPLDMVELNPVNRLEYDDMIDSLPDKFDKSFSIKSCTAPAPPPAPPPPQAVSVVAMAPARMMFLNFLIELKCR